MGRYHLLPITDKPMYAAAGIKPTTDTINKKYLLLLKND